MKKFRLISSICMLILSVACLAFGVYSATTASFSMSGNVSFTASDMMYVTIEGTYTTYITTDFSGSAQTTKTFTLKNYTGTAGSSPAQTTFMLTSQTGDPTINNGNFNFGDITFSENGIKSLKVELKFYNNHPSDYLTISPSSDVGAEGGITSRLIEQNVGGILPGESGTYTYQAYISDFSNSGSASLDELTFSCEKLNIPQLSASNSYGGITYSLNNAAHTASITNTSGVSGDVLIPLFVKGNNGGVYRVTSLGNMFTWSGVTTPINVTLARGITDTGNFTFMNCSGLTTITIPSSVTSIGNSAFNGCSGLTEVTIPSSVTSIENNPFSDCSSLTSITVESGNPVYHSAGNCLIGTATKTLIAGCNNSIIPTDGSVTSIGNTAFSSCSGLTEVTIPSSVTSIGHVAFLRCSGLTSITISSSVTSIGMQAFYGCSGLTSVTFENPTGWKAGTTPLDLTDLTQNATYLKNNYSDYTWTRT